MVHTFDHVGAPKGAPGGTLLSISVVLSNSAAVLLSVAFVNMLKGAAGDIRRADFSGGAAWNQSPTVGHGFPRNLIPCGATPGVPLAGGNPVLALFLGLALGTSSSTWQMLCPVLMIMLGEPRRAVVLGMKRKTQ